MNPNDLAPGHNPDGLTIAQVGEGYRLTELEECGTLAHDERVEMRWSKWIKRMESGVPLFLTITYRVPITIPAPSRLGRLFPITEPLPPVPEGCVRYFSSENNNWVPSLSRFPKDTHYTDIQLPTTEHP